MKDGATLWVPGAGLGGLITLGSVFGMVGAILVGLLVIPLARRPRGAWGVAGTLTGFGAIWLFLILGESNSGGQLDNATFWAAVGAIPLAMGVVWTAALARYGPRERDID